MDYISVEEAVSAPGLRLVLSAGVPGPWGEAAKSLFYVKGIPFTPVMQVGGGENPELRAWTGQSSAPVAVYGEEQPRCESLAILHLAERLNPEPALIPAEIDPRMKMFGFIQEIIGEGGFGWQRRLTMLKPIMTAPGMEEIASRLGGKYGYSEAAAEAAPLACARILRRLAEQLKGQQAVGSSYFIGESLTALDIYWATFAAMLKPLAEDVNPMPDSLRQTYESLPGELEGALEDILFEHRDSIYAKHLLLPLDY